MKKPPDRSCGPEAFVSRSPSSCWSLLAGAGEVQTLLFLLRRVLDRQEVVSVRERVSPVILGKDRIITPDADQAILSLLLLGLPCSILENQEVPLVAIPVFEQGEH